MINHWSFTRTVFAAVRSSFILVVLLCSSSVYALEGDSFDAALKVIERLHSQLLVVMQFDKDKNFAERYATLAPVVAESFDMPAIIKIVLGRFWKTLSDHEKTRLTELFERQSVATYASRFRGFNGEIFVILKVEPLRKGRLLIRSELRRDGEAPIKFDYLMHYVRQQWMIIGVVVDGVNDLSLKRAEYSTLIEKGGIQRLVDMLEANIVAMGDNSGS